MYASDAEPVKIQTAKGQLISEWLFGVFNFPQKKPRKIWWIFALEFRKWLNQAIKGHFSC